MRPAYSAPSKAGSLLLLIAIVAMLAGLVLAIVGYRGNVIRMLLMLSSALFLVGYVVSWMTTPRKVKLFSMIMLLRLTVVIVFAGLLLGLIYPQWRHELRTWTLLPFVVLLLIIVAARLVVTLRAKIPAEYARATVVPLNTWELDKYCGVYMHDKDGDGLIKAPAWITIALDGDALAAQAKDQRSFPLEAIGNDTFRYVRAGVIMEFDLTGHSFVLKQYGKEFSYRKETTA